MKYKDLHSLNQIPASGVRRLIVLPVDNDFGGVLKHAFDQPLLQWRSLPLAEGRRRVDLEQPDIEVIVDGKVVAEQFKAVLAMAFEGSLHGRRGRLDDLLDSRVNLLLPGVWSILGS